MLKKLALISPALFAMGLAACQPEPTPEQKAAAALQQLGKEMAAALGGDGDVRSGAVRGRRPAHNEGDFYSAPTGDVPVESRFGNYQPQPTRTRATFGLTPKETRFDKGTLASLQTCGPPAQGRDGADTRQRRPAVGR